MFEHEYLEYIAAYALGALDGKSTERLEAHLREGCEICEPELYMFSETVSRLPQALPQQKLPAGLKEKIRLRLESEIPQRPAPPKVESRWWMSVAAVLAIGVIAGLLYWNQSLQRQLARHESSLMEFEKELRAQRAEISWLRDPGVQLAMLTGLAAAPDAKARMIWHPTEHKGIFYVQSLPQLSAAQSYQLWVIGSKGPVSAGIFEPNKAGAAVISISKIAGEANGSLQFAVTIEPHGGVPQPTGSMVLAGKPI